jgi:hypothetical protein
VSKILEVGALPVKYPRVSDVSIKTIAIPVVRRVRNVPAPLLPKMVALDPPNTAPISAPLPVCKSTTRISPKLTTICITTTKVITFVNSLSAAERDSYATSLPQAGV